MQIHYGTENLQIVNPVVTIGSFDGVHKGHVQVIESLKRVARNLKGETVIISFEPHPREVLYPMEKRPGILTTLEEKAAILATYGVEHLVVLQFTRSLAELEYADFVRHILVDKIGLKGLVVGYDHRFGKNREGTFEKLKECSEEMKVSRAEVIRQGIHKLKELADRYHFYLEQEEVYEENQINISSTKIRNALQIGDIDRVNEFLGYTYSVSGKVVAGDKIGRSMGFPTANIRLNDDRKLLPAAGVYAVKVKVEGQEYRGMLNIGVRPTVSCSGVVRIEVNIFDFDADIYGKEIRLLLIARIRGERKFNGIDELSEQLKKDRQEVSVLLQQ